MTDIEMQVIRALAEIDTELGMPDNGCNSTENTITAIRLLHAVHRDDEAEITRLRGLLRRYRNETPLCHQPHMLAHLVDEALWLIPSPDPITRRRITRSRSSTS